jgi:cobalt-zinc-cadmium efflux system membrane fusion protein
VSGCHRQEEATATPETAHPLMAGEQGIVVIPANSPMLEQLRVAPVGTAELPTEEIVAPGKIEENPNRVSHVVLPVPGRITKVMVKLGDAVSEEQPLLMVQSPDADAAMSGYLQAQASVTQAQAALGKARADFDRLSDLYAHGAVAKKEVLDAQNSVTQAKATLEQAVAAHAQAAQRLSLLGLKPGDFRQQVVVRAPLAGKVLELSVVPGEYRNDTTASVITIADLSAVWVASDVPESYIRFVQVGEPVEITLVAYPGETFTGRVMRIADTVDPQTRTIKVRAELENPQGRFRPEMFGSIHHIESLKTIPVVPAGAVIQADNRSSVFVQQSPGHFRRAEVSIGKRTGDLVPILNGVHSGDQVVVDGAMLLNGIEPQATAPSTTVKSSEDVPA